MAEVVGNYQAATEASAATGGKSLRFSAGQRADRAADRKADPHNGGRAPAALRQDELDTILNPVTIPGWPPVYRYRAVALETSVAIAPTTLPIQAMRQGRRSWSGHRWHRRYF